MTQEVDISNVKITFKSDAKPLSTWIEKEIKQWFSESMHQDVEVTVTLDTNGE